MKLFALALTATFAFANPLQDAINAASPGDTIELGSGVVAGDIVIDKPLTIDGHDKSAVIRGSGTGNVVKITAPNVKLKNLTIENSGDSHTTVDAGIKCENANGVEIEGNEFRGTMYGIYMDRCGGAKITNNRITSKPADLPLRGDAIRLIYCHDALIKGNYVYDAKDVVLWYCTGGRIAENYGRGSRYSLHFMYSNNNLVENNVFEGNTVGMFFMYSQGCMVRNNRVSYSSGSYGIGTGLKEASDFKFENNIFSHNARGIYTDNSPYQPNTVNTFTRNQIIYNTTGIQLHATQHPSVFENNDFIGNMDVAINDTPGSKIHLNQWRGNYFDDYEGYDRDRDGTGDVHYKNFAYLDSLWQYYPNLRLFYGSSVMSVINFLAKLAPFSEPELLVSDDSPKMRPNL